MRIAFKLYCIMKNKSGAAYLAKSITASHFCQKFQGCFAAKIASKTAGSIFATLIFLPQTKFIPIQKIKTEPIKDKYATAVSVITGDIRRASKVMHPSNINTGIAEKVQPFPIDDVITAIMIKSKTDFTASVE